MKLKTMLLLFLSLSPSRPLHAQTPPPAVSVPVRRLFFPTHGYVEGDDIQLILQGDLPDPCFELEPLTVSRDAEGRFVFAPRAWRHSSAACDTGDFLGESSFSVQTSVGHLPAGDYGIVFNPAGDPNEALPKTLNDTRPLHVSSAVAAATAVLSVTEVEIPKVVLEGQSIQIVLHTAPSQVCGEAPALLPWAREGDTLVITPVESPAEALETCPQTHRLTEGKINLGVLPPGQYLLHVRSAYGKSIEKILNVIRTHPLPHPLAQGLLK